MGQQNRVSKRPLTGDSSELIKELELGDRPENPKRTYDATRCWLRGGSIDPVESLDREFLGASQDGARLITGDSSSTADDFLQIVRVRCICQDKWRLRIENAHGAAAEVCGHMRRAPERYEELTNQAAAQLKGEELTDFWSLTLEPVHRRFEELAQRDRAAKLKEVERQNKAHEAKQAILPGGHPFTIEFPDLVPELKDRLLAEGKGLIERLESELPSGDIRLLSQADGSLKRSVSYKNAGLYVGCGPRQIQKLVFQNKLSTIGGGHNKQITVESLLVYCPPKSTN